MPLFNPKNEEDVQRLKQALISSKEDLQPLLRQRKECLTAYQGHRFSPGLSALSASKTVDQPRLSIPLMEMAIDLHEQLLAGETIRAVVSSASSGLKPLAGTIKESLDLLATAINLTQTFQDWVKETLWGWGVAKVGMSFQRGKTNGRGGGFNRSFPIPFVDIIDSADLLVDTKASKWNRIRWIGNEYLVPLEWAKDSSDFDATARKELQEAEPNANGPIGSSSPISRNTNVNNLFPLTQLQDVYLPLDNMMITMGAVGPKTVLHSERFKGPSIGPYHLLGYEFVPDTVVPKPMAWSWIDAHDSANTVWNKALRQALRSKRNPVYPQGSDKDADRLRNAQDGEWVAAKADLIKTFSIPGADPSLLGLVGQLINLFSFMAGNMNLLGGLSAQSPTLGQDQILAGAGSRRMAELQRRSKLAFGRVMESLAWYLFQEPKLRVNVQRRIGNHVVSRVLRHEDIKGRFLDFNFTVEPIRHKSPDERLALLLKWVREVILPMQGQMGQGAQGVDLRALNELGRDMGDIPELDRIVKDLGSRPSPEEMSAIVGRGGAGGRAAAGGGGQPSGNGVAVAQGLERIGASGAQPSGFT